MIKFLFSRFRNTFLSLGSSVPMAETFRNFRGRDPSHEALLLSLGLKSAQHPKKKGGSEEN
jgi:Zn-dependent oligopeptidase